MFDPSFDALIPLGVGPACPSTLLGVRCARRLARSCDARVHRGACVVASPSGSVVAHATEMPVVGDWVVLRTVDRDLWVDAILPRWSRLARAGADDGPTQVMAANVDIVRDRRTRGPAVTGESRARAGHRVGERRRNRSSC